MEGFWTVQFNGIQGRGAGVVTLIGGQLFGGDSGFLYTGTYTTQGDKLDVQVNVRRFAPGVQSVMGRDQFDLRLSGTLNGSVVTLAGTVPGTEARLSGTMNKQGNLPR